MVKFKVGMKAIILPTRDWNHRVHNALVKFIKITDDYISCEFIKAPNEESLVGKTILLDHEDFEIDWKLIEEEQIKW